MDWFEPHKRNVLLRWTRAAALVAAAVSGGLAASGARADSDGVLVFPLDRPLDLDVVERWVVERNPNLEVARQSLEASRSRSDHVGVLPDPRIFGEISPASVTRDEGRVGYGLGVRQMIPLGKLGSRSSVASYEAEAKRADLYALQDELLHSARYAFVDYALAVEGERITEELIELVDQVRRGALSRYASGLSSKSDPLQAEAELAHLEHQILSYERDRKVQIAKLNSLLRRKWNSPLPPPAELAYPEFTPDLDTLLALAARKRPEIASAEAMIQSSEAKVTLAGREYVPDLEVYLGYQTYMDDRDFWPRVGLGLTVPLYFGRISAEKREAEAELALHQALRVAEQDRVDYEVHDAYLRVNEHAHQVHQFDETWIPVSQRALEATIAGYESGKDDIIALINAERQLANARLRKLAALVAYHQANADLLRAIGDLPGDETDGEESSGSEEE